MAGIEDPALREVLNGVEPDSLVEYLFARLGLAEGSQWLRFRATDGNLRTSEWERGPVSNTDLRSIARPVT
jgi:hypothetical protein